MEIQWFCIILKRICTQFTTTHIPFNALRFTFNWIYSLLKCTCTLYIDPSDWFRPFTTEMDLIIEAHEFRLLHLSIGKCQSYRRCKSNILSEIVTQPFECYLKLLFESFISSVTAAISIAQNWYQHLHEIKANQWSSSVEEDSVTKNLFLSNDAAE